MDWRSFELGFFLKGSVGKCIILEYVPDYYESLAIQGRHTYLGMQIY